MKKKIHILHFKLNEKTLYKLSKIAKQKNKSISSMVTIIFEQFLPFLEKNHFSFQDKKSRYQRITNSDEKRHSVLAYIPEEYYRKLKQIHQDLNVYSIAQIMRKIITIFIKSCKKYGFSSLFYRTKKLIRKWNWIKENYKTNQKELMIQLLNENNSPPYISITYDQNSKPRKFKFL